MVDKRGRGRDSRDGDLDQILAVMEIALLA